MRSPVPALAALAVLLGGCGTDDAPAGGDRPAGDVDVVAGVQLNPDGAALSPDGTRLAAPCEERLCVWDTTTGRLVRRLDGGEVAAFTPDGARIVTADGPDVVVRDATTGAEVERLEGHRAGDDTDDASPAVRDLAVSTDGLVASAGSDGTVRLWSDGAAAGVIEPEGDLATDLAFSPDGRQLAVASTDSPAEVWDVAPVHRAWVLDTEPAQQGSLAWRLDGQQLASASAAPGDGAAVLLWDTTTHRQVDETTGSATDLAWSPDGSTLAMAVRSPDGLALWRPADGGPRSLSTAAGLQAVRWSPDGRTVHTVAVDGVRSWAVATGTASAPYQLP
ncbi:hypothetical protein QI633_05985 [Nocardioides sp. QY071]|uniref:WD40 repeat domain-containing protein n=1 Tax=Nocardioides sp. QY071 TaxID=3044187 RepID=UPI00249B46C4|nr:hypothetical protein [Nocardioides sp. QY071]WGY03308.1 hypothetical protein QI633_05985 [Nocardioides sp. QY071]